MSSLCLVAIIVLTISKLPLRYLIAYDKRRRCFYQHATDCFVKFPHIILFNTFLSLGIIGTPHILFHLCRLSLSVLPTYRFPHCCTPALLSGLIPTNCWSCRPRWFSLSAHQTSGGIYLLATPSAEKRRILKRNGRWALEFATVDYWSRILLTTRLWLNTLVDTLKVLWGFSYQWHPRSASHPPQIGSIYKFGSKFFIFVATKSLINFGRLWRIASKPSRFRRKLLCENVYSFYKLRNHSKVRLPADIFHLNTLHIFIN